MRKISVFRPSIAARRRTGPWWTRVVTLAMASAFCAVSALAAQDAAAAAPAAGAPTVPEVPIGGGVIIRPEGRLKICKVAGPGIAIGTPFTFNAGGVVVTVPAGPAPGGTCVLGPLFPVGLHVTVFEQIPAGDTVSSITVGPPNRLWSGPSLPNGSVIVTIGPGVTEVTFTNQRTGFLEICKQGDVRGSFTFYVTPGIAGNTGPFVVPAGGCSPAIEVPAGSVIIHEAWTPAAAMTGCSTLPTNRQVACNPAGLTSTVTVPPGDVSTQTIAIITNRPRDPIDLPDTSANPN
jgi:hypothetical protein